MKKTALVTGSSSGIGFETSLALAREGFHTFATMRDLKKSDRICEIAKNENLTLEVLRIDVDDEESVNIALKNILEKTDRIDILVNNAGTTKFANHSKLDELSSEDFSNIYRLNVIGAYQMIKNVEPYMKKNGFGSIVNVSSIAGLTGIGSSIAYAASKGALNTMTLSLARALAPEIRVNAVCPGFIGTGWFENKFGKEAFNRIVEDQKKTTPLKRAGTPDDIANSVIFFCLEGGDHITGETLIADAGMHLSLPK